MVAGLVLQLRLFHDVIDANARACNDNFTKVEQSLRMSAEAIRCVGDTLRGMKDEGDWWKNGQSE